MQTRIKSLRLLIAASIGIAGLLSLLLFVRLPGNGYWLRTALDTSHGPVFAAIAVLVVCMLRPGIAASRDGAWPDWSRGGRALGASVVIGVLLEYLQFFQGRPPSAVDVLIDVAGAVAGLSIWTLARRPAPDPARTDTARAGVGVTVLLIVAVLVMAWRPVQAMLAYAQRAAISPALVDFPRGSGLHFVSATGAALRVTELPADWASQSGEPAAELRFRVGEVPMLRLDEPRPDWRGFKTLALDLVNPGPDELTLDVHLWDHDAYFNRREPSSLAIRIPAAIRTTTRLNLAEFTAPAGAPAWDRSAVELLALRGGVATAPGHLYVTRIWLE